jgi:choline kinase
MRAIILAAGRGMRLQLGGVHHPKCLLRFNSMTLIERHIRLLGAAGVDEIVVALGFHHELVEMELDRLDGLPRPEIVLNPKFELGSMLTVHAAADAMTRGGDVLLMDADVLYDARITCALVAAGSPGNRLLIDRQFEAGDEPVKVCLRDGIPIELRKILGSDLQYDTIGESVGFFRFDQTGAGRLAEIVAGYVARDCGHLPHEEAVRDLILEDGPSFGATDITGAPWIEIDFPIDVTRAEREILPLLEPLKPSTAFAQRKSTAHQNR